MTFSQKDPETVGTERWWDNYFSPGGGWELNNGRRQTEIFARSFLKYAGLNRNSYFSLLDVGCALGDAISLFRNHFPNSTLFGIDISKTAIARCQTIHGHIASFKVGTIQEISQVYDVIYSSNVLEHLVDYKDQARHLAKHGKRLFILVPFDERRDGKTLEPNPHEHHQNTFDENSFNFLLKERLATNIIKHIIRCIGAWSWNWKQCVKEYLIKNPLRLIAGKPFLHNPKMILFDIQTVIVTKL